jgi:hypothetical protein
MKDKMTMNRQTIIAADRRNNGQWTIMDNNSNMDNNNVANCVWTVVVWTLDEILVVVDNIEDG